jgi:hypothetical protein
MRGGRGGDIRHLGRDRRQPRVAGEGQAEQRALQVERRQGFTLGDHGCGAGQIGEQGLQAGLHLHVDGRALSGEQGYVAHQLERVAGALFRMEQEGTAGERFAAPDRLGKAPLGAFMEHDPAVFVLHPGVAAEIAAQEADLGEVELQRAVARFDPQGALVGLRGMVEFVLPDEGHAETVPGFD